MSAPVLERIPVNPAGAVAGPNRGDRRWLRIVAPIVVAVVIILGTLVAHAIEEPSTTSSDYLNPASTAGSGSATLAGALTAGGAQIAVARSSAEALSLAARGDVTLVVPAPQLVRLSNLGALADLPADVTVLLVRPSQITVFGVGLGVQVRSRWASRAARGCPGLDPGTRARVYRDHYGLFPDEPVDALAGQTRDCFEHSLQGYRQPGHAELVLVGADDIFRNNRIGELDNAAVARSLFAGHRAVVWLDLHHREVVPRTHASPPPKTQEPRGPGLPVPTWVKAAAAGLALAALLAAVAAGRRLGPPVSEPLPVLVRGTETALGRGRLYRRARARGVALQALRDRAVQRLRDALALPPDASPDQLVTAVAQHLEVAPEQVRATLYGPEPADDEQLTAAVGALDALVDRVLPAVYPEPEQHPTPKEWP